MNDLGFYFIEGWHHIISLDALDHQLFIVALCALWLPQDWKKIIVLVTAFTIGHSLTLALSALDVFRVNTAWVEFLIPCTIVVTAVYNLLQKDLTRPKLELNYGLALGFGLIHGLGFANTLRMMLSKDQSITEALLAFNVGLEIGQLLLVALILSAAYILVCRAGVRRKWWVAALSVTALVFAAKFAIERMLLLNP